MRSILGPYCKMDDKGSVRSVSAHVHNECEVDLIRSSDRCTENVEGPETEFDEGWISTFSQEVQGKRVCIAPCWELSVDTSIVFEALEMRLKFRHPAVGCFGPSACQGAPNSHILNLTETNI